MKTLLIHFRLCDDATDKKLKETTMATDGSFAALNGEEKDVVLDNINAKNTIRQTHIAVILFREYLTETNMDLDFENCPLEQLDQTLSNIYMEMRNKKVDTYKKSTLLSYRQDIQRHISQTWDIDLKGDAFKKSNKAFQYMNKELKKLGLAAVNHYPHIEDTDLAKMHTLFASNPDDAQLPQYKVSQKRCIDGCRINGYQF